jgi:hypothetical protein
LARRPVGLLGNSAAGVGRGSWVVGARLLLPVLEPELEWELGAGSWELELGVCAEGQRSHPLNFLRSSVVLGPKGAILAQPLPSPSLP